MKDKDLFIRTQYLAMYIRVFPFSLILAILGGLVYGWCVSILIMIGGLLFPLPAMYATGRIADFFLFLYSGGTVLSTLRDQFAGDVERIRILKRESRFTEALELAEMVLTRDPEHPEALLLKAQILYEGLSKYSAANACLSKILAMDPAPDEKLRNWAISLRKEVLKRIRERQEPDRELRRKA
uniref:tetratricopeptide repeat protein n=1 Tax=Candidatus Electrothrix sp. TaxID=2170559 RepID=UPI004056C8B5